MSRFINRYSLILTVIGISLAVLVAGLFHLRQQEQRRIFAQLADRQAHLTAQAAAQISHHLRQLQQGLSHLAVDEEPLQNLAAIRSRLDFLADNYSTQLLIALYIKDRQGNIRAQFPAGALASHSIPVHLLSDNPTLFSAPVLLTTTPAPYLLLGQPIYEGNVRQGELVAVVSVRGLASYCLDNAPPHKDGACLLMNEDGVFLLHPDAAMIGRSFAATVSARQQPELFRIFSAMHKGKKGWGRYRDVFLAADASSFSSAPENFLTYTPLQVPGALWSLATALPGEILAERSRSDAGLRFALSLGLIGFAIILFPSARFLLEHRTLLAEKEDFRQKDIRLRSALDLAERRYRHLLDNAGDAIFFIEPESGALQEINRQMEELLGYSAQEIRTLSLAVLFPGWQHRRYLRLVKRVLKDGYGEEDNLIFRRKDGSLFAGAVHARLGELGAARAVHGTLRDVSERKRIEQELRQKNRDLLLLNDIAHRTSGSTDLKHTLDEVLVQLIQSFAADGGGIYLLEEDEERLELAASRSIDQPLLDDLQRIPSGVGMVGRVATSGQPRTSADLCRDHRVRSARIREAGWRSFQAVPIAAKEKTTGVLFLFCMKKRAFSREEVRLLLAVGRQLGTSVEGARLFEALKWQHRLTEASNRELEASRQQLKKNLVQVEESNRLLEQLERVKSNFLAIASHELRTPLTYILPSAEFLTQRLGDRLDADEMRFLQAIDMGGKRLKEIVNDLLEVARLESKNLYLGRVQINLQALVREVGAEFLPVLDERGLTFSVGEFPAPLNFHGDPDHLRKALSRLVENAVKFTPQGGSIEIEAQLRTPQEILSMKAVLSPFSPSFFRRGIDVSFVQLTVHDTGIGIHPEERLRIFDKFYEVGDFDAHFTSQTRFGGKGVGLGLTLVRGMVEAHGGMVWVGSRGDREDATGSSFHVLLPLAAEGEESSRVH